MIGYLCYCEPNGLPCLGIFPTREQAESMDLGDGVVETEAGDHVHELVRPVYFTSRDQSYPELNALLG